MRPGEKTGEFILEGNDEITALSIGLYGLYLEDIEDDEYQRLMDRIETDELGDDSDLRSELTIDPSSCDVAIGAMDVIVNSRGLRRTRYRVSGALETAQRIKGTLERAGEQTQ